MLKKENNPWLGLASYKENDADKFYGRETELEELRSAICNNPFTTVYGISGAGKTSLINAGMIPLLKKENYLTVPVRLEHQSDIGYNTQIISAIEREVAKVGGEVESWMGFAPNDIDEDERLWNFLFSSRIWSKTNYQLIPVVFIDQFEEIFTMNEESDRVVRFFETINSLQYNIPPEHTLSVLEQENRYVDFNDVAQYRMVFVLREDFLARLEDYSIDIPALRRNRRGMKRMNGHQALEVILKPCPDIVSRDVAIQILGKVVGKEVRDSEMVLDRLSVDTSILSLFCSELYQKAAKANADVITAELVNQFGDDIIATFYEDTMASVSKKTIDYIEAHLLTYSGFRNTVALEDMMQNGIKEGDLQKLAERRLIRIETSGGTDRVEFMHDVLCKVAKEHRDGIKREKIIINKINSEHRTNNRFLVSTLLGTVLFVLLLFFNNSPKNTFLIEFGNVPHLLFLSIFLSLSLYGAYSLLFNKKQSDRLTIIRYLAAGAVAILMVLGIRMIDIIVSQVPLFSKVDWKSFGEYFKSSILWFLPYWLFLLCSCIVERFSKKGQLVDAFKAISFASLTIPLLFLQGPTMSILLFLFALFVLNPYRFTKEKNSQWIAALQGLLVLLSIMLVVWNKYGSVIGVHAVISFVIALVVSWTFVLSLLSDYQDKKRTPREAWNYCISFGPYSDNPFYQKTLAVLSAFFVIALSVIIGIGLNDDETILGVLFLAPASYALVKYFFYGSFKSSGKITLMHLACLICLAIIIASQYLHGRLIWLAVAWVASMAAMVLGLNQPRRKHKHNILPNLAGWFVALICIPVFCIGYNVFSLLKYDRVYGSTIHVDKAWSIFRIKGHDEKMGLRERWGKVIFYSDDLAAVVKDNKVGFVNIDGEFEIDPKYKFNANNNDTIVSPLSGTCFEFRKGLCSVIGDNGFWGVIDKNDNWVVEQKYDFIKLDSVGNGEIEIIVGNGHYGLSDWVIRQNISIGRPYANNKREVRFSSASLRLVDKKGDCVVDSTDVKIGEPDEKGDREVRIFNKLVLGVINKQNKWSLKPEYVFIGEPDNSENRSIRDKFGYWGLVNNQGEWLLTPEYVFIGEPDGNGNRIVRQYEYWGLINEQADWLLTPDYGYIGEPDEEGSRVVGYYHVNNGSGTWKMLIPGCKDIDFKIDKYGRKITR